MFRRRDIDEDFKKTIVIFFTIILILVLFAGVVTANASSPPTITGFSPNGSTIRTPTCTMQATGVSNPATGVTGILFVVYNQADGGEHYVGYYSDKNIGGGTYQATFNNSNHITKTGTFIVNVFCVDSLNSWLYMNSYSFVVDTSPKMTGFSPDGTTISTPTCTMQATGVSNPATGVTGVLFAVYNQADGGEHYVGYYSDKNIGGGTYQVTFNSSYHITKTGTFIVNVFCVDSSNSWLYMNSYSFVVDTSPKMTGFSPDGTTIRTPTCTMQATGVSNPATGVTGVLFAVYNQADVGEHYVDTIRTKT